MSKMNDDELIKKELKKYMNNIKISESLEGIIMKNVEKGKKDEKNKISKKKKIIAGVACFVVVIGTVSATTIIKLNKPADITISNTQTLSNVTNNANNEVLNIELTDKDLYAVGFGDFAFIENGEVYYGYEKSISKESTDVEITIKKISGIKDAVSIGAYELSSDVSKTFYITTESGNLYSLTQGIDCKAIRVFEDYEIKSVLSAQGEENQEFIFVLNDNQKIKINTYRDKENNTIENLGTYSSVNVTGNKGNVQKGSDLYYGGFQGASFIINGNAYLCKPSTTSPSGDITTLKITKIENLNNIKNIKGLAIGTDPTITYFAVKDNGEVYDFCNGTNVKRTEIMKKYSVDSIISSNPNGFGSDGMDVFEIKIKLTNGSIVSVYTGDKVDDTSDQTVSVNLVDSSKKIVYSYIDETILDTASTPSDSHIYQIPKVNINSDYANEINSEIKAKFEKEYTDNLANKKSGYSISGNIKYQYYINNNVLSLVVANFTGMNDYIGYAVYNIDCKNGKKVEDIELLKRIGMNETEYTKLLESAKQKYSSDVYSVNQIGIFIKDNKLMTILDPESNLVDRCAEIIELENKTQVDAYQLFDFNM